MEELFKLIVDVFLGRILSRFFGYYTLLLFFKITFNKKGIKWLKDESQNEGDEFFKGCLIQWSVKVQAYK